MSGGRKFHYFTCYLQLTGLIMTEYELKEKHLQDAMIRIIYAAFDENLPEIRYQLDSMKVIIPTLKAPPSALKYAEQLKTMAFQLQEPIFKKQWSIAEKQIAVFAYLLDMIDLMLDEDNKSE